VLSVEPDSAPAIISSLRAGRAVTVPTASTIMAGLNCGTPSANAWPVLRAGLDAAVVVTDGEAAQAVRDLEKSGVDAGPCGAAALAGVRALIRAAPLAADATVLLLSTEGRAANPLPAGAQGAI
jgi:diaminopropionate ammonia-lyase